MRGGRPMNKKEKAAQENRTPKQLGITLQKSEEDDK